MNLLRGTAWVAKLLVFDPATKTSATVALPVRGLRAITAMATAPDGKVWMIAERYVLSYDPSRSSWSTVENAFPEQAAGGGLYAYDTQMVLAKDGTFYAAGRGFLFRINPTTGEVTRILKAGVSRIGLDGLGNVYTVYAGSHLLRYVIPPRRLDDNSKGMWLPADSVRGAYAWALAFGDGRGEGRPPCHGDQ